MKTVITEVVDSYQIVIGFGIAMIDPIETQNQGKVVYFVPPSEPPLSEEIIEDATYIFLDAKFAALSKNQRLTRTGDTIIDKRGVEYFIKSDGTWIKSIITNLGIDIASGGSIFNELSDAMKSEIAEQINDSRILALSPEDKTTEKAAAIDNVVNQAIAMRSKLEIQGLPQPDALTQAQNWYNQAVETINLKYSSFIT